MIENFKHDRFATALNLHLSETQKDVAAEAAKIKDGRLVYGAAEPKAAESRGLF